MDLQQRKLNKSEWESIEMPVSEEEKEILNLIKNGYANVNVKYNKSESLFSFLRITTEDATKKIEMEDYLYNKYFSERVKALITKYKIGFIIITVNANITIKKADTIRMQKNTVEFVEKKNIYEYLLLSVVEKLFSSLNTGIGSGTGTGTGTGEWVCYYYTLYKLLKNSIAHINRHVVFMINKILEHYEEEIDMAHIITNGVEFIERNEYLLKYGDRMLYQHQKQIFTVMKDRGPKLVLYIAPTGTGKTMSPIGLSESHRIIFVCAARHVGLALAKASVSIGKKIAFAFGCASAEDVRLHYFAAKDYTKNFRTGGIWKVDNAVGDKVEIMICDIKSYLPAMYYMLAFNSADDIITYWDEPTITFDYEEHDFHAIIKNNWTENVIPNMVLSSATLPKLNEIPETVEDFKVKFPSSQVHSIVSHDCKKSIPILNKDGFVVLPHNMSEQYTEILKIVEHCENYLTLMRYFDMCEVIRFICFLEKSGHVPENAKIKRHFASLDDLDMINIKLYYLKLLKKIIPEDWTFIYSSFQLSKQRRILPNETIDPKGVKIRKNVSIGPGVVPSPPTSSGGGTLVRTASVCSATATTATTTPGTGGCAIYVTTKDAYTLTDGPTIFLATDVEKIAKFCIQQASIPSAVMKDITDKIEFNNKINEKIGRLQKELEDQVAKKEKERGKEGDCGGSGDKKNHKFNRSAPADDNKPDRDAGKLYGEMEALRAMIKISRLNDTFIPNTKSHLKKWAEDVKDKEDKENKENKKDKKKNAFVSVIEDATITQIMLLEDVEDSWKVLLLMGIGVFTNHNSITYTEIMKNLADQQKLYMIIASSDYIYGTNYQFCHGYLSKDMQLTQEKIIQAMGRIGRNNIQQDYTIRFRDDDQITKLFTSDAEKPEVRNMNLLFNSKRVVWNGHAYTEEEEDKM